MSFLKWVLIAIGALTLLGIAVVAGGTYWLWRSAEAIKLSEADLQVGGPYPPEERAAVQAACSRKFDDEVCSCIVKHAGAEMSHVQRLMVLPALEGFFIRNIATSFALAKASGVPEEKIKEAMSEVRPRLRLVMEACGLKF